MSFSKSFISIFCCSVSVGNISLHFQTFIVPLIVIIHVIPDRLDDDQIRSLCGALAVSDKKSHWIITINGTMNVWKCKLVFPTDKLQQKIEITDLKPFLAGENTSGIRLLHSTVCYCKAALMLLVYTEAKQPLTLDSKVSLEQHRGSLEKPCVKQL